jgi:Metallo-peptidase family M12
MNKNRGMLLRAILPGLLTAMIGQSVLAQQTATDTANVPVCGFGQIRQQCRLNNPDFDRNQRVFEQAIQRQIETHKATAKVGTVYTLPVVVHVIHTGGAVGSAYNPTDANIQAMIATLNATWRKNGSQYGGVDTQIQFQLATRDPNCAATTGINRVNGSGLVNYTMGGITNSGAVSSVDEVLVKNLSRWSNTDYINIWVVNKINGSETGTAGYAYFPAFNSALTDGIVVRANTVNGTSKVISHEMGHVFGLSHTFSDDTVDGAGNVVYGNETTCPANTTCTTQGDGVCDTEPHKLLNICTNLINECTVAPFQIADAGLNYTVLNNYMGGPPTFVRNVPSYFFSAENQLITLFYCHQ